MSEELIEEKRLLRSIAGGWANRRNFANFLVEEVALFLKLQATGLATIEVDDNEWRWAVLTEAGRKRLQTLNRNLPS